MSTPQGATIFMIDSDTQAQGSVCTLVHSMNLEFEGFATGREFFRRCRPSRPGCVITEVRIADIGGLEIQRRLAASLVPLPVIFLSAYATLAAVVRAMQAGAVDFLEKPLKDHELWEAIQEAIHLGSARREQLKSQHEQRRQISRLSPKERRVLHLLAGGRSRRSIASELKVSVRTVELARARAMKKLQIDNHAELLRFTMTALRHSLLAEVSAAVECDEAAII